MLSDGSGTRRSRRSVSHELCSSFRLCERMSSFGSAWLRCLYVLSLQALSSRADSSLWFISSPGDRPANKSLRTRRTLIGRFCTPFYTPLYKRA
jgi:hypothetical protein